MNADRCSRLWRATLAYLAVVSLLLTTGLTAGPEPGSPAGAWRSDLNGDGIEEIVLPNRTTGSSFWNADGTPYRMGPDVGGTAPPEPDTLSEDGEPGVPVIEPGWPKVLSSVFFSSPTLADVAGGPEPEIVVGCYDNNVHIWDGGGNPIANWPQATGGDVKSTPAVGDIDTIAGPEVVVGSWDHYIYAWHVDGTLVEGAWPLYTTGVIESSPALGDLDQDGILEIVIAAYYGSTATLYALNGDGSAVPGWPKTYSRSMSCTPALADIDGDSRLEVIVGTSGNDLCKVYVYNGEDGSDAEGWPADIVHGIGGSPVVGDIDNDDDLEIIVGTSWWGGIAYVFNSKGGVEDGWPKDVFNNVTAPASLADFDDDDDLEIVFPVSLFFGSPYYSRVYIFEHDGEVVANWPVLFSDPDQRIESSPAIADIDADGQLEVVFGSADGGASPSPMLYAFNYDASSVDPAWPLYGEDVYASPAVGDIDSDDMLEIMVGSWHDHKMHCWNVGDNTYPAWLPWPMYHHDKRNTGYQFDWICGDANGDGMVNIGDIVFIIGFVFRGGPEPFPYESGDANCDEIVNVGDAVYLIAWIFQSGPPPCDPDGNGVADCYDY